MGTGKEGVPGSDGEKILQSEFDTVARAWEFYEEAMQDSLTDRMEAFLADRRLFVVGSSDGVGRTHVTAQFGIETVSVHSESTIAITIDPRVADEHLENVAANGSMTLLAVDWTETTVGLHVNGSASVIGGRTVELSIDEAYVHCAKHVPRVSYGDPFDESGPQPSVSAGHHDSLTPMHRSFLDQQVLFFLGTVDRAGETDVSPRLGPAGFLQVLDASTIAYPEYRGNGVHASLGNMLETKRATITVPDWWNSGVVLDLSVDTVIRDEAPRTAQDLADSSKTKSWVEATIDSVQVRQLERVPQCSIEQFDPPWGTDDEAKKKVGFFSQ